MVLPRNRTEPWGEYSQQNLTSQRQQILKNTKDLIDTNFRDQIYKKSRKENMVLLLFIQKLVRSREGIKKETCT